MTTEYIAATIITLFLIITYRHEIFNLLVMEEPEPPQPKLHKVSDEVVQEVLNYLYEKPVKN